MGKTALTVFASLAVFDLVGAILCFFLGIVDEDSPAMYYTLWFVLAVFCGMLSYITAADMTSPKTPGNAGKPGLLIIFTTIGVVAAVSLGCYLIWWRDGSGDSAYIPDNEPLSITFFVTVIATSLLARHVSPPEPVRHKK